MTEGINDSLQKAQQIRESMVPCRAQSKSGSSVNHFKGDEEKR